MKVLLCVLLSDATVTADGHKPYEYNRVSEGSVTSRDLRAMFVTVLIFRTISQKKCTSNYCMLYRFSARKGLGEAIVAIDTK